jgi:hypothetical protein
VHGAVRHADRVVEVAAEQHPLATGLVADLQVDVRVLQQRGREQAAFEAGPFGGQQLGLPQLALGVLGTAAFDRVPDAAQQQFAVDLALDQVVLRAGRDRGDAFAFVVPAGQHQDRGRVRFAQQPVQRVQPGRVRQAQVEQHALGVAEQPFGFRQRAGARQHERRVRLFEQRLDEEGVAIVVLHQEDAHCLRSHRVGLYCYRAAGSASDLPGCAAC